MFRAARHVPWLLADTIAQGLSIMLVNSDSAWCLHSGSLAARTNGRRKSFSECHLSHLSEVIDRIIQWLDYFLMHAHNEKELLHSIMKFLRQCRKYSLKLYANKCKLFQKEANCCDRIIDASGMRYNPRDLHTLLNMCKPEFASDLKQCLCATNWMRKSIPEYFNTISPLHKRM